MRKYLELKKIEYQNESYVAPVNYAKKFYLCLSFDKVTGEMISIMENNKRAYLDLDFSDFTILYRTIPFLQWKEKSFKELSGGVRKDIRNDFLKEMI